MFVACSSCKNVSSVIVVVELDVRRCAHDVLCLRQYHVVSPHVKDAGGCVLEVYEPTL